MGKMYGMEEDSVKDQRRHEERVDVESGQRTAGMQCEENAGKHESRWRRGEKRRKIDAKRNKEGQVVDAVKPEIAAPSSSSSSFFSSFLFIVEIR